MPLAAPGLLREGDIGFLVEPADGRVRRGPQRARRAQSRAAIPRAPAAGVLSRRARAEQRSAPFPPRRPLHGYQGDCRPELAARNPLKTHTSGGPWISHRFARPTHASVASATAYSRACASRRLRLRILPLGFLGRLSTTTTALGTLKLARCCRQCAITASSASSWPAFGTTTAVTASIHTGCGRPTTATSATPGSWYTTSSTSRLATFSPPLLIMSFLRSTTVM